ncbi:MAG: diguanylate cyclase [Pseudomonadota bacterium]
MNVCRDITERKQRELEYGAMVQASMDGFYAVDPNTARILDLNDAYCEMVGYSREELLTMRINDLEAIESPQETAAHIRKIVENGYDRFETRHRRKDGTLIDLEASVRYLDVRGGVFFTFMRDITARKRAEEELKIASTVFQFSNAAIMVTDESNRIVSVNPAFTEITGYEFHEVIGQMPSLFKSPRQTPELYEQMWQALNRDGYWEGELWNRHKNGRDYAEFLTISTILDKHGELYRRVAVFTDITEKKHASDLMWRQANYDHATDLPNRRLFFDRLEQEIKKCHRSQQSLALFFLDLDRFKEVNDTHGHDIGDKLLRQAALRINNCVRDTDTVARMGGDEFTVILSGLTETTRVRAVAQNILNALVQPFSIEGIEAEVSCSIGIALYPLDAPDQDALIRRADAAMYAAKSEGRNRFKFA